MKAKRTRVGRLLPASLLAGSLLCGVPGVAFAVEEGSAMSLIIPSLAEFLPMLIAFIVVCIVLAKFAWPVIIGIVDKREAQIKSDLTKAEANRIESEQLLAEYKTQLAEAKKQAAEIVADAKKAAEAAKADITAAAEAESAQMIAKAKEAIEMERRSVVAGLQQSAADLSIAVAERFISQDLSDDEHRRIIERYVEEAGSFNAS